MEKKRDRKARRNARHATLRASGLCVDDCGRPSRPGRATCSGCGSRHAASSRQTKGRYVAAGLCSTGCGRPAADGRTLCVDHGLKRTARGLGGKTSAAELVALFAVQSGVCPLTGRKLTLGVDAHLDHIDHKYNDAAYKHCLFNLRWVYGPANRARGTMTDRELYELVVQIANGPLAQKYGSAKAA